MKKIFLSPVDLRRMKAALEDNKKIEAIKIVRAGAMDPNTRGLREAKEAVEKFWYEMSGFKPTAGVAASAMDICTWNPIKRIVADMGDGEMEVDLEEFQFKILTMEGGVSVDSVGHLLDLLQVIKDWEKSWENSG